MFGVFLSERQAKTLGRDVILCAVKKLTREITAIVRERLLPCSNRTVMYAFILCTFRY